DPNEFITYVIPDFNAVRYFQKAFIASGEFHLLEESTIYGFDIYLVEKWVNERKIGTVISTFTGNMSSKVSVMRFTIFKKQSKYYPLRFQEYLNELLLNHSKIKHMDEKDSNRMNTVDEDTRSLASHESQPATLATSDFSTNEVCFVTSLTSLPSDLNLVPIASGDSRSIETDFAVNSDLKKLQCTGRSSSLLADKLSDANEDKFRQMYKIYNFNIPVKFAIRELVNVIQICLFYFDLLDPKYCDGLLCNKTEEAILNWWNLIGLPHFNVKPNPKHGILHSRTVAAIISLVLSIKMRLHIIGGCDVPKDPFDFENFMLSIGQFQKQYKLEKRRKLDLETLNKLFTITNAKLIPDKSGSNSKQYHSPENSYDFQDNFYELTDSTSNVTIPRLSLSSPIQHRKNKSYYGMELKKLTNVVKSTVSDRINISNRDADEPAGGGRFRNRIAKLADSATPLDVETLDLEFLVKTHLTGKTLIRLFRGVGGATAASQTSSIDHSSSQIHLHHDHSHGSHSAHLDRRGNTVLADDIASRQYEFVSLRDRISQTQPSSSSQISDLSRYSRGLTKVKLGIQNRRNLLSSYNSNLWKNSSYAQQGSTRRDSHSSIESKKPSLISNTIVDSLLQIPTESLSDLSKTSSSNNGFEPTEEDESLDGPSPMLRFSRNLNRRNSFPFLLNKHEANLNLLVLTKKDNVIKPVLVEESHKLRKSASCSQIENYLLQKGDITLDTLDTFSDSYISSIGNLMKYDNLKKSFGDDSPLQESGLVSNTNIQRSYQLLNLELKKLNNVHHQMNANKVKVVDEDLIGHLKYDVHGLTTTIDRLCYETRIVVKRINELDENCKLMNVKLNDQSRGKLNKIVESLVNSRRFQEVFTPAEQSDLISKLGGSVEPLPSDTNKNQTFFSNMFESFVIFIFELFSYLSQLFKFDRANMNLERIRQSWVKLDPDRELIKSAYTMIGREPARDSVASIETLPSLSG
ncbi:part of protein complex with Sin3p and Stb1p, partial [Scheffersomyces stipitis CBS 6054]